MLTLLILRVVVPMLDVARLTSILLLLKDQQFVVVSFERRPLLLLKSFARGRIPA